MNLQNIKQIWARGEDGCKVWVQKWLAKKSLFMIITYGAIILNPAKVNFNLKHMRKQKITLVLLFLLLNFHPLVHASDSASISNTSRKLEKLPSAALFTPPKGWRFGDQQSLSRHVKIMVVGKGKGAYPPSINLATERFTGTLKDYLKIVKKINEAEKVIWKDLGSIRTLAGNVNLSQIEIQTEWGQVKMMHAIKVDTQAQMAYILTAAAMKEEFPEYYKDFFNSIQSLQVNKDLYETIKDPKERLKFKKLNEHLEEQFDLALNENASASPKEVFQNSHFQDLAWKPYLNEVKETFAAMGEDWQNLISSTIQSILTDAERIEKK